MIDQPVDNHSRANYAPSLQPAVSPAQVTEVTEDSPASRAGVKVGDRILTVNGLPLHDHIDWLWESDDSQVELMVAAADLASAEPNVQCGFSDGLVSKTLTREWGEDWGIAFDRGIFDGMRTCRNNCVFCFMSMLPTGDDRMRDALYVRDDDYRLSFLQGNFVTLTNTTDEDIDRIIDYNLAPIHVSVHSTNPEIREQIIGKNQQRGLDALAELLQAGVEVHTQIVLMPGVNDGEQLQYTLDDLLAYNNVISVGIVPLGYTRYQDRFTGSYSDDPALAKTVVEQVAPIQQVQRTKTGRTRVYLADEFYLDAKEPIPPRDYYDDFPQYEDGIGMIRTFLDEVTELANVILSERSESKDPRHDLQVANTVDSSLPAVVQNDIEGKLGHDIKGSLIGALEQLGAQGKRVVLMTGELFAPYLFRGIEALTKELDTVPLIIRPVRNEFFGGNVTVTGLLTGSDLVKSLAGLGENDIAFIPDIVFNDDAVTLDDLAVEDLRKGAPCEVCVVSCTLTGIVRGVLDAAATFED